MSGRFIHILVIIFTFSACQSTIRKPSQSREPSSLENIPVSKHTWIYYAQMTINELEEKINLRKIDRGKIFIDPKDNNFTQFLNNHFNEINNIVRSKINSNKMPSPKLIIHNSNVSNAFVAASYSCLKKKLIINKNAGYINDKKNLVLDFNFELGRPFFLESSNRLDTCIPMDENESKLFINYLKTEKLSNKNFDCDYIEDTSNNELEFKCKNKNDISKNKLDILAFDTSKYNYVSQGLSITRKLPFVFVNFGLFKALNSWEEYEAVLFHELAHYYLPHHSSFEKYRYNYFYSISEHENLYSPEEIGQFHRKGQLLIDIGKIKQGRSLSGYFDKSIAAEYLYNIIGSSNFLNPKMKYEDKYCQNIFVNIKDGDRRDPLYFHDQKIKIQEQSRKTIFNYLYSEDYDLEASNEIFSEIKNCLLHTKVNVDRDEDVIEAISYFIPDYRKREVFNYFNNKKLIPSFKNMWQLFEYINTIVSTGYDNFVNSSKIKDIGYYTTEEEADIFASEFINLTGNDTSSLQTALISILKYKYFNVDVKVDSYAKSSGKNCIKAYKNDWSLDGKKFRPLLNDFKSNHHNFCYRIYNLDKFKYSGKLEVMDSAFKANIKNKYLFSNLKKGLNDLYQQIKIDD